MTKKDFLKINEKIGQCVPDVKIRQSVLKNEFKNLGLDVEEGFKTTQYFYNELLKKMNEQESIFEGKVIKNEETFAIVDSFTCYFKMAYKNLFERKEVYFPSDINNDNCDNDLKLWIDNEKIKKFEIIEKKLIERNFIDFKYDLKNGNKQHLIDLLFLLVGNKYFKKVVNGKELKYIHQRQFIANRYCKNKTGLTETNKKYKSNKELAKATFYYIEF